jgi:beta-1,4-mannosyl-glycoprotein beta-1,4-N-acetylglucosaminyltransferase
VVDRHVIVEATHDQVGNPKPLYFDRDRFAEWPIEYVIVGDMPLGNDHWGREHFQRDACVRGMPDLRPDDLVFISDLDEIPDPRLFQDPPKPEGGPVRVEMSMHLYYLNWRWLEVPVAGGTRACFVNGEMLRETKATVLCEAPWHRLGGTNGWHLAYQGGVERIQRKLRALADFRDGHLADKWQERWASREHLAECLRTGRDLFDRAYRQCEWVGLSDLPPVVQKDPKRWAHMMIEEPV